MEEEHTDEYSHALKITRDRLAVLIGKKGEVKRELENLTKTKIQVDSKEGDVVITGKDPLNLFALKEVIKAIGRGFNPEVATLLMKQDYMLELISLSEYAKGARDMARLKGRVIGQDGKGRKTIENLTETKICVYGKTVGIIGDVDKVPMARRAVESLLGGSRHATVFKWLEGRRRDLRVNEEKW